MNNASLPLPIAADISKRRWDGDISPFPDEAWLKNNALPTRRPLPDPTDDLHEMIKRMRGPCVRKTLVAGTGFEVFPCGSVVGHRRPFLPDILHDIPSVPCRCQHFEDIGDLRQCC